MIFCSRNERGDPAWRLVVAGRKSVTRRLKPLEAGKAFTVQPSRRRKAVARVRVVSCVPEREWLRGLPKARRAAELKREAKREGFLEWEGLREWLKAHNPEGKPYYRIGFKVEELVKEGIERQERAARERVTTSLRG